ncbi:MAG: Nif3-like dinuclear metal center hexameric protein, partial [Bacteroidaceae bacterium]|nr:Nif3-like dinuclear metal center hexameric protein [Bacteroidaceae bacterium]
YTKEIFYSIIKDVFPGLKVEMTSVNTNPINYL